MLKVSSATPLVGTNLNKDVAMNFSRYTDKLVTWTGGDPNGYLTIAGQSPTNGSANTVRCSFSCTARASDGQFTIPNYILTAMPVTGSAVGLPLGYLSVISAPAPTAFSATGLELALN